MLPPAHPDNNEVRVLAFIDEIVIPFLNSLYGAVGYVGVMLAMAIESAMVPLPSELILPYAGFLVSDTSQIEPLTGQSWNFLIVAIVLSICNPHRAVLRRPVEASVPVHIALGDVLAWRDPAGANEVGGGIILAAEDWCILPTMPQTITEEQKQTYASLYLLKKIDLKPAEGGLVLPVVLPSELSPIDETLQQLAVDDLVAINAKKNRYELTPRGIAYLGEAIDEAEALVDEFDDHEVEDAIAELRTRNLDVFRARFLWGWFEGEFDDLVMFQERRGVSPVERMWAFYLMSDEFWAEIARELAPARALPGR